MWLCFTTEIRPLEHKRMGSMNVEIPLKKPVKGRCIWSRLQIGARVDDEAELLDLEQEKLRLMKTADNRRKYAFRAELLSLIVITSVFGFLGFLIWRLVSYCDTIRISVSGDIRTLTNLTMRMVSHTENTLENVIMTTHAVHSLSANSLPSMIRALNDTATMVTPALSSPYPIPSCVLIVCISTPPDIKSRSHARTPGITSKSVTKRRQLAVTTRVAYAKHAHVDCLTMAASYYTWSRPPSETSRRSSASFT